jgi:serine/threonine-protein kinase HipA
MERITKVTVNFNIQGKTREVGQLVLSGNKIAFKYHPEFLKNRYDISPFYLKRESGIQIPQTSIFNGLHGVFADSLPDGWGQLLMERSLAQKNINIKDLNKLECLAYVGKNGMGALEYKPVIELGSHRDSPFNLDKIASEVEDVLIGKSSDVIDELRILGGSSGGARPKILIGFNHKNNEIITATEDMPPDFEHWLIKFPTSTDFPDIANVEYAYHLMALDAGVKMSDCRLFESKRCELFFGTKRFDRCRNNKLHLHSAAGIMHDDFRHSTMDYGHLMDCAFRLVKNVNVYQTVLRLATFNVFSHNQDDHSKNFSFLMDETGEWHFAPAYDLTYSHTSFGMHSTLVAGESKNPGKKQLQALAYHYDVENANDIIEQVKHSIANWVNYAKQADVTKTTTEIINKTLQQLLSKFG